MFHPVSLSQNKDISAEPKRPKAGPSTSTSVPARTMGHTKHKTTIETHLVNPLSIASVQQVPKVIRPVPIPNKVLISFDDDEITSDSQDFGARRSTDCPLSFSQASQLSFQNEVTGTVSSATADGGLEASKENKIAKCRSSLHQLATNKDGHVRNEEPEGKTSDRYREKEMKQKRDGGLNLGTRHVIKFNAESFGNSGDGDLCEESIHTTQSSILSLRDIDSIPPASIVSIESPAFRLRPDSPHCTANHPEQDTKKFLTPPLHFGSSKDEGSKDSKASGSLSSMTSSRGDDQVLFDLLSSFQSSDGHLFQDHTQDSVSSSSSFKSDDVTSINLESARKSDWRRKARDQKRVLRIFDRRVNSTDSRDIMDNPWFQAMAIESELREHQTTSQSEICPRNVEQKGKRTKMLMLGRSLKNQGKRKKLEKDGISSNPSPERIAIPKFPSGNSASDRAEVSIDIATEELRYVLRKAISGKRRLGDVLECMMRVYSRPSDNTLQLLYKYFGCSKTVEASMKWILEEYRVLHGVFSNSKGSKAYEAYIILSRIYREILLQIFTTGPSAVRKTFLHSSKVRAALIRFFQEDVPRGRLELKSWAKTSITIFKILSSLMSEYAPEVVLFISSKDGLIRSMIAKYICFPEVVSFVSKLCAADALSEPSENHLRYGPPNTDGILLLAKENVIDTLAQTFVNSCNEKSENSSDLTLEIQRNSLQCLKDLSLKAVTMPKFGKTNCSMNAKQIKMLNTALETISLFSTTTHVQEGIEYALKRLKKSSNASKDSNYEFECNYPLIHVLSLCTDLLNAVLSASTSKKFAVKRTIGTVNTTNLEEVLVSKMDDLCHLLVRKYSPMSTSSTRLCIIQLLGCLFASCAKHVWDHLSNKNVPELLLTVVEESELPTMIHQSVIGCLEASLRKKDAMVLRKQWIENLGRNHGWRTEMLRIVEDPAPSEAKYSRQRRSQVQCTYLEMTYTLIDIANSVYRTNLSSFFAAHNVEVPFIEKLESEMARLRDEQIKPCGGPRPEAHTISVLTCAESLAARLDDVNAV